MSIASDALAAGSVTLDATHGESVTFRGATLTGVTIDRRDNYRFNQPTDAPRGDESVVRFLHSALAALTPTTAPVRGEFFNDADGWRHTIARAKRIDDHWVCECNKFKP